MALMMLMLVMMVMMMTMMMMMMVEMETFDSIRLHEFQAHDSPENSLERLQVKIYERGFRKFENSKHHQLFFKVFNEKCFYFSFK